MTGEYRIRVQQVDGMPWPFLALLEERAAADWWVEIDAGGGDSPVAAVHALREADPRAFTAKIDPYTFGQRFPRRG